MSVRPLYAIAREIQTDHDEAGKEIYFGAVPYVNAMRSLTTMDDSFGHDPARDVVIYALSNLTTWRGETARRVKAELKSMLKSSR